VKFDAFISYASEDKEQFVRPLAHLLKALGYSIWFDEFELRVGDPLRERIDLGLSESRFGIIVLSNAFFLKQWPKWELDALFSKEELAQATTLLPVWHGLGREDIAKLSPLLAGRLAVPSASGVTTVASKLTQAMGLPANVVLRSPVPQATVVEALSVAGRAMLQEFSGFEATIKSFREHVEGRLAAFDQLDAEDPLQYGGERALLARKRACQEALQELSDKIQEDGAKAREYLALFMPVLERDAAWVLLRHHDDLKRLRHFVSAVALSRVILPSLSDSEDIREIRSSGFYEALCEYWQIRNSLLSQLSTFGLHAELTNEGVVTVAVRKDGRPITFVAESSPEDPIRSFLSTLFLASPFLRIPE
jgi:hypothetical protein